MQGGFSYQDTVFNRATQATRQPGSSFKPFVYAAALDSGFTPGTIVVDTKAHYLYLVQASGKAVRYGVGLGRDGFAWSGRGVIERKAKWPHWTPSDEMVERSRKVTKADKVWDLEPGHSAATPRLR